MGAVRRHLVTDSSGQLKAVSPRLTVSCLNRDVLSRLPHFPAASCLSARRHSIPRLSAGTRAHPPPSLGTLSLPLFISILRSTGLVCLTHHEAPPKMCPLLRHTVIQPMLATRLSRQLSQIYPPRQHFLPLPENTQLHFCVK